VLLVPLVLAGLLAPPPTVSVGEFSGPQGERLRASVLGALGQHVIVLRMGSEVDGVIEGRVTHLRRRWRVTVTVRTATDARSRVDDILAFTLARPALSRPARRRLVRQVLNLLESSGGEPATTVKNRHKAVESEDPDRAANPTAEAASPIASPARGGPAEGAGSSSDGGEEEATVPAVPPPKPRADQPPAAAAPAALGTTGDRLALVLGLTFQLRSFQSSGASRLPIYNSSAYPSIYLAGTFYPLARAGLGLFGTFEYALGLKSRVAADGATFDSTALRFEAGALWRLRTGGPTGLTLRPFVLYGQQSFEIGGMTDMPDTAYGYVGMGAELDLPVFVPQVAVTAHAEYDVVLGIGDIDRLGGGASSWGASFDAGLRADLPWRLRGSAVFTGVLRYTDYDGMGGLGARSAEDRWLGGRVALALVF
jgi:hypothetical protein